MKVGVLVSCGDRHILSVHDVLGYVAGSGRCTEKEAYSLTTEEACLINRLAVERKVNCCIVAHETIEYPEVFDCVVTMTTERVKIKKLNLFGVIREKTVRNEPTQEDRFLIKSIKMQGFCRQSMYSEFVKRKDLKPGIDADQAQKIYDEC